LAKQYAQSPRLPAVEAANRLGRGSLNMEHMLRRGISYLQEPPYFSALFRALYHSHPEDENRETMRYAHQAYAMRHFPNFLGNLYHEECFAPLPNRQRPNPWAKNAAKEVDKDVIRNWLVWQDFNEWAEGKPADVVKIEEARFRGGILARHYALWGNEVRKVDPNMMNAPNHGPCWGYGKGNYTPAIADATDFGFSHLYTDRGTAPFHGPMFVEWWRRGQTEKNYTPVWIAPLSFGRRGEQRRIGVAVLGRKVEGLGWNAVSGGGGMVGAAGLYEWSGEGRNYYHNTGRRERISTMDKICLRYGDMFLRLKRQNNIAVLCSLTQSAYEGAKDHRGIGKIAESHLAIAAGACHDLMRAHYTANMMSEEVIGEGGLKGYNALVLAGVFFPLPKETTKAIKDFIRQGGIVFGDERTKPEKLGIEGIKIVEGWAAVGPPLHIDGNEEHVIAWNVSQKHKKVLLPFLREHLKTFADCDDSRIMMSVQEYGKGKYIFATNDTVPPYHWKTKAQAWLWQLFNYPFLRTITLSEPGVVY
ncbi:MAG: hypothetical protein QGD94_11235, partial [Planctomycetia bacterium]|nr:hypothetical protein [Planctomycetia bacterium]